MKEQEEFYVELKFIQKESNSSKTLQSRRLSYDQSITMDSLIEDITNNLLTGLLITRQMEIKFPNFSFYRKFDIELTLNENKILLSSLRKSGFITFQIPDIANDPLLYERKLTRLKEFIEVIMGTLIRAVYVDSNVSNPELTATEHLLTKRPDTISLNDYQIYLLLRGLKEPEPRNLASRFENHQNTFTAEDRVAAEKYLSKLKDKYGSDFLMHLTELPIKPFSMKTVKRLFDAMSKTKGEIVRLTFDGSKIYEFKLKDDAVIVSRDNKVVSKIDREGRVNFISSATDEKYISATLMLFYGRNHNEELIYFGQQTGTCSFCRKPLEDPISVFWGYGKTCAETFNLPWG